MTQPRGTLVGLRDGSTVLIDQVHRGDAQMLAEGFDRLSMDSRRMRFLTDKARLSPREVEYFTQVDHHDHEAIGAMDPTGEQGVGVARYIRDRDNPAAAEIAVAVIDEWQGRGLGTELLTRIMDRAHDEGIHRVTALVAVDNEAMLTLMQEVGADLRVTDRGGGAVGYEFDLEHAGRTKLLDLLRAFGQRQIRAPLALREALTSIVFERLRPSRGSEGDDPPPPDLTTG